MLYGSSVTAGILGITEPAVYGVNLPLRRPFIIGCVAAVSALLTGTVLALDRVPHTTFASGLLGSGAAIIPSDNRMVAPFAGVVASLFQTKHAIGLLLEFDRQAIIDAGYDLATPIIISNNDEYRDVVTVAATSVNVGAPLLSVSHQ